ncbi:MAG: DUF4388 domain-containing protein [Microthrixaceae bacterium]
MALQGTIDTFPLTDVLALLETSAKTGLLTLTGDRGSGRVWLDGENILGGTLDDATPLTSDRVLFELLRFEEGSFEFSSLDPAEIPEFDESPMQIKSCVESAQQMLEQWDRIESIVPSLAHRISLAPELPVDQLSVDGELWSFLVAVSASSTVADAATALAMDSYEGSAVIASLIEQQLVDIAEPAVGNEVAGSSMADRTDDGSPEATDEDAADTAPNGDGIAHSEWAQSTLDSDSVGDDSTLIEELQQEEAMWVEPANDFPERFPIDDLLLDDSDGQDDPWASPAMAQLEAQRHEDSQASNGTSFAGLPEIESVPLSDRDAGNGAPPVNGTGLRDWDEMVKMEQVRTNGVSTPEETADEVLRQMSKLSPKAAEAIAAALGSAGDEPRSSSGADADTAPDATDANRESDDDSAGIGPVSFLDSF